MKKRVVCAFLGLVMMVSQSFAVFADTESDIKQQKAQAESQLSQTNETIASLSEQQQQIQSEINAMDADMVDLMIQIDATKTDIASTEDGIAQKEADITEKEGEIETTAGQLQDAEADRDKQYADMKKRIQYIYENGGNEAWLNMLSGAERSIVTEVAGTTRDVIEDTVNVGDIMLRLADTAGIRDTDDRVESIGVELAKKRIGLADLVLAVFDITKPLDNDDKKLLELVKHKNTVVILNKSDMGSNADISAFAGFRTVVTSAVNGGGYDALCSTIADIAGTAGLDPESAVLINERQRACAERALDGVNEAIAALNDGNTVDAVGVCVDDELAALLELTGRRVTNEVSDEIFRKFCVGK